MGIFGLDYFGVGRFGATNNTAFSTTLTATPVGYTTLALAWQQVTNYGNGVPGNWDFVTILRSSYGHPTTIYEGTTLFTDAAASARTNYIDADPGLKQGHFYYYTLFVHDTIGVRWVPAARATGLVSTAYMYGDYMFSRLPGWYQEGDSEYQTVAQPLGPLQRFLEIFGTQFDRIRTETETLRDTYNFDKVSGGLLPLIAYSLNVPIEPEIGVKQLRVITRNAVHLTRYKGTSTGVSGIVSAYTGYGAVAQLGINQMLDLNESSFEQGIGTWTATNATLTQQSTGTGVTPLDGSFMMRSSSTGAGNVVITHGTAAGFGTKIPVIPLRTWTASVYFQAPTATTGRACSLQINWYTNTGTLISTTAAGAAVTDTPGAWARATVTALAPATAAFATITGTIAATGGAAELHYIDAVQMEVGLNYLTNTQASFEDGTTTGWAAGVNTTIANSAAQALDGTKSMSLTSTATGAMSATTPTGTAGFPVVSGTKYVALSSLRAATTGQVVGVQIFWYKADGSASIHPSDTSGSVSDTTTGWTQVGVAAAAPADAVFASIQINVTTTGGAGEVHYVDQVSLGSGTSGVWKGVAAATAYAQARNALIYLTPLRQNISTNPSFEVSTANWTPTNAVLTRAATVTPYSGSSHGTLTASSAADMSMASGLLGVIGGTVYTASAFLQTAATARSCTISIQFFDINQVSLGAATTGSSVSDAVGAWSARPFVTATAPLTAYYAVITVTVVGPANGEVHYVDAIMGEPTGFLNPFFDGQSAPATDYSWLGTVGLSPSYYYPRRDIKTGRLQNVLPQWLPLPETYTLVFSPAPV